MSDGRAGTVEVRQDASQRTGGFLSKGNVRVGHASGLTAPANFVFELDTFQCNGLVSHNKFIIN